MARSLAFEEVAGRAAKAGGAVIRRAFNDFGELRFKSPTDVGVDADINSEQAVISVLRQYYPDHSIDSEECGHIAGDPDHTWMVDPLDGTNNFACGISYVSCAVTYLYKGEPFASAIFEPFTERLFSASLGGGARINGAILTPRRLYLLEQSTVSYIQGHKISSQRELDSVGLQIQDRLRIAARRVIQPWAPALDWCLLSAGLIQGVISFESEEEDLLPGLLIAREAGVTVRAFDGGTWQSGTRRVYGSTVLDEESIQRVLTGIK